MKLHAEIADQLNIRRGMVPRECSTLDDAVLWCCRHDIHPAFPWDGLDYDPTVEERNALSLPLLEDYLGLILSNAKSINIASYARSLLDRIDSDLANLERYCDGGIPPSAMSDLFTRFTTNGFDKSQRDRELSIYPFDDFDIRITEDKIKELQNNYVVDMIVKMFSSYFPKTIKMAKSLCYISYTDKIYCYHVDLIHTTMRSFIFSNAAIPAEGKFKWRMYLDDWARHATLFIRPRMKEDFTG
ncbi:hypothetical protein H5V43_01430 [Sphingobium fuliginis]|jgi:hypothetical protein|uniref:Uncharacterized protein n=1 Tax=Sphingobium fuliginis (strain ATCC 27551) TaxID=336203 RepID=A0A7M2GH82_SPHSA|nr:hypothetical protein [Sphingobium fuliginis]QOT71868.1 hypothetical protein H5V43_01430 [Sphingobium fuliginis]